MDQNQEMPVVPAEVPSPVPAPDMSGMEQSKRSKAPFIICAVIIVLGLVAWGAYTVYASPDRLWQKFAKNATMPKVVSEDFSFSYEDKGKVSSSASESPVASIISNLKFSANGKAYIDSTNISNPESSVDMNYSFGAGNFSLNSTAKMVLKDQNLFINLGQNPFADGFFGALSPDKKVEWLKVDMKKAKELEASYATGTPVNYDYASQVKMYKDIEDKYLLKLIGQQKFIDKQTLHGMQTYHYSVTVNKDQLVAMLNEIIDALVKQVQDQGQLKDANTTDMKLAVNKVFKDLISRTQISSLEIWVGTTDSQLHKIKLVSNAPSLASFISASSDPAVTQTQDSQQILDLMLSKITFEGQFNLEEEFYDFGKTTQVTAPADSFDLFQKVEEQKAQQQQIMQQQQATTVPTIKR